MARLVDWVGTYSSGGPNSKAGAYGGSRNHHQKKDPGEGVDFLSTPALPAQRRALQPGPASPAAPFGCLHQDPNQHPSTEGAGAGWLQFWSRQHAAGLVQRGGCQAGDVLGW